MRADPGVDAVIVLFARTLATRAGAVADALAAAAEPPGPAPVLAVFMGADQPAPLAPGGPGVPRFAAPEEAVRALARAVEHGRRLARPPDPVPPLAGIDADRAAGLIAAGLADGGGWLPPAQVETLLRCYGLRPARGRIATTARAAARAAGRLDGPVSVKAVAPGLVAKSDVGAVALDLSGPTAVERAARGVLAAAREHGHEPSGVLVQEMARGTELLLGIAGDPRFGPLVAVGAGGATGQLVGDVQVRLAPVGAREAEAMVAGLRTFPLLDGFRGHPRADLAAVARRGPARRRARGGPPGDRRARLRPGGRRARRRDRGRRARPARAAARGAAVRGARALKALPCGASGGPPRRSTAGIQGPEGGRIGGRCRLRRGMRGQLDNDGDSTAPTLLSARR